MDPSCLKLTTLKILSKDSLSGYNLMKSIELVTGRKPSPGSIYPLLKELKQKKFIDSKKDQRSIIYSVTPFGKNKLKELIQHSDELISRIQEKIQMMNNIIGEKDTGIIKIMEKVKKGEAPFSYFTHEMIILRDTMLKASERNLTNQQKSKVIQNIQKTTKEIKQICKIR